MIVDTAEFDCHTCSNHGPGGCATWCDHGEAYSPDYSKLTALDSFIEDAAKLIGTMKNNKKAAIWLRRYGGQQKTDQNSNG